MKMERFAGLEKESLKHRGFNNYDPVMIETIFHYSSQDTLTRLPQGVNKFRA